MNRLLLYAFAPGIFTQATSLISVCIPFKKEQASAYWYALKPHLNK